MFYLLLKPIYCQEDTLEITNSLGFIEDTHFVQQPESPNTQKQQYDSIKLAKIHYYKGRHFEKTGDFKKSKQAYNIVSSIALPDSLTYLKGLAYIGLSNSNFRFGHYQTALETGLKASKIFSSIKDTSNYIQSNYIVGQVYLALEKYEHAHANLIKAKELCYAINDSNKLAVVFEHLGVINSLKKEYNLALGNYFKSVSINKKLNNNERLGINYANIGEVYMYQGKYTQAINYLLTAKKIEMEHNNNSSLIFINYMLGNTYSQLNLNTKALKLFNESLSLINTTGEEREKAFLYLYLSEHYYRTGDYKKAYENYKNHSIAKQKNTDRITHAKIDELRIKYDVDKKNSELLLLEKEKQFRQNDINAKERLIKFQLLAMLLIIIGLISSVAFTIYFLRSKKSLKLLNQTKDILFSIIGHDLRGPMGNIIQLSNILEDQSKEKNNKIVSMIKAQASTSYNLLNDLLSWSYALKKNQMHKPGIIYAINPINKAIALLKPSADKKQINILCKVDSGLIVNANNDQIETIFRNILSNAIKYTPENGTITINTSKQESTMVQFDINDTGIGIEPKDIDKILNPNTYYSSYGTNNEKGSGLGFKICLQFIKLNKGKLFIKSTVGKGTTVSFTLPTPKSLPI